MATEILGESMGWRKGRRKGTSYHAACCQNPVNNWRATAWCKFCGAQLPKARRACQSLTILTSTSIVRHSPAQILQSSTSKSAPNPQRFNDFDFEIALAPQRGANFAALNFQKYSDPPIYFYDFDFQIAFGRRRANFVDILGNQSSAAPRFSRPTSPASDPKPRNYRKNTTFRAIPTRQNLSCLASARYNISAVQHRCCET